VLAIVLLVMKKFLRTEEVSFPQPYAFEPTSARVNYHDDAESSGSVSDDEFQESTWKWPIGHQELTGASAATVFRCLPTQSVRAVLRLRISRTDEIRKRTHLRLAASRNKKAQLMQGLRATAPSFQDGHQPPSWILSNQK